MASDGKREVRMNNGTLHASPGAMRAVAESSTAVREILARHLACDWGDALGDEDRQANEEALVTGGRLLSAYYLPGSGQVVWVITDEDRATTTIMLPEEY